jgi:hypothetical protein
MVSALDESSTRVEMLKLCRYSSFRDSVRYCPLIIFLGVIVDRLPGSYIAPLRSRFGFEQERYCWLLSPSVSPRLQASTVKLLFLLQVKPLALFALYR